MSKGFKDQVFTLMNTTRELVDIKTFRLTRKRKPESLKPRVYRCNLCGLSFKRNEHLARHQRIHTGEKPFCCPVPECSRPFPRSDNLKVHIKTCHRTLLESSPSLFTLAMASASASVSSSSSSSVLSSPVISTAPSTVASPIESKISNNNSINASFNRSHLMAISLLSSPQEEQDQDKKQEHEELEKSNRLKRKLHQENKQKKKFKRLEDDKEKEKEKEQLQQQQQPKLSIQVEVKEDFSLPSLTLHPIGCSSQDLNPRHDVDCQYIRLFKL